MPSLYGAVKSKTGELLQDSVEYCKGALQSVSRSFALTIPLVEENILGPIMVGYLEARILDTFEDDIGRREITLEENNKYITIDKSNVTSDIEFEIKYKNPLIGIQKNNVNVFEDN